MADPRKELEDSRAKLKSFAEKLSEKKEQNDKLKSRLRELLAELAATKAASSSGGGDGEAVKLDARLRERETLIVRLKKEVRKLRTERGEKGTPASAEQFAKIKSQNSKLKNRLRAVLEEMKQRGPRPAVAGADSGKGGELEAKLREKKELCQKYREKLQRTLDELKRNKAGAIKSPRGPGDLSGDSMTLAPNAAALQSALDDKHVENQRLKKRLRKLIAAGKLPDGSSVPGTPLPTDDDVSVGGDGASPEALQARIQKLKAGVVDRDRLLQEARVKNGKLKDRVRQLLAQSGGAAPASDGAAAAAAGGDGGKTSSKEAMDTLKAKLIQRTKKLEALQRQFAEKSADMDKLAASHAAEKAALTTMAESARAEASRVKAAHKIKMQEARERLAKHDSYYKAKIDSLSKDGPRLASSGASDTASVGLARSVASEETASEADPDTADCTTVDGDGNDRDLELDLGEGGLSMDDGADDWSAVNRARTDGLTLLYLASELGQTAAVAMLLSHGAFVDSRLGDGTTPLMAACTHAHARVVDMLLNGGADMDSTNAAGFSPLVTAARAGQEAIIQELLLHGASVSGAAAGGTSALGEAARAGHAGVTLLLLASGANVNGADQLGVTPLYLAAAEGHLAVVECLLDHGANPRAAIADGSTPLFVAAEGGHLEAVEALLAAGADVSAASGEDETALFAASGAGHAGVVEVLLKAGASVEARADNGATALFAACMEGHEDVVRVLLAAGADAQSALFDGTTPLQAAEDEDHDDVVAVLTAHLRTGGDTRSPTPATDRSVSTRTLGSPGSQGSPPSGRKRVSAGSALAVPGGTRIVINSPAGSESSDDEFMIGGRAWGKDERVSGAERRRKRGGSTEPGF